VNNGEIVYVGQNVTGYNASTQQASPERTFDEYGMNVPYKIGTSTKNNAVITSMTVDSKGKVVLTGVKEAGYETTKGEGGSVTTPLYENFEINDQKQAY